MNQFATTGLKKSDLAQFAPTKKTNYKILYGLPTEVKFCTRCVISNQRPNSTVEFKNKQIKKETIIFDKNGVCSACLYAEIKDNEIDWHKREKELIKLCNFYRSKKGNYDCIVPGSGGKDSAFAAHILKYKFKMNPLTVTWAPHVYTDVGFGNFQSWIQSGFDNVLFSPNGKLHRLLTKLAFQNLLHPFQPFIVGQRHIAPKSSVLYNIPLVFYGENPAEYGNNIKENYIPTMNPKFYEETPDLKKVILGGVSAKELIKKYNLTENELLPYIPADKKLVKKVGTTVHYLGYYLKWDPQEAFYYASENTGFKPNTERTEGSYSKYSSIDDRIDPFHYYTTLIKFGIGRATYDASQEVRNKKITREEGVGLVKRFDGEFPAKYFKQILEYMDLTEEDFWTLINKGRSSHLWKFENDEWSLRHGVWMQ